MSAAGEGKVGLAIRSSECIFGDISSVEPEKVGEAPSCKIGLDALPTDANSQIPNCPNCGPKTRVYRDGLRVLKDGSSIQRWLCMKCGYRFSASFSLEQSINRSSALPLTRQICAKGAKNLTSATELKTVAGDLEKLPLDAKGLLTKFMAYLERENYYIDEQGGSLYLRQLVTLVQDGANLLDSEDVKTKIARHTFKDKEGKVQRWKDSSKNLAAFAYQAFCEMQGIPWKKPVYKIDDPMIRAPLEEDIDALIASTTSKRMAAFLKCIKETYADPGEILAAEWIDLRGNIFSIAHPVKGHNTGEYEISGELLTMLNTLPKTDKRIFPTTYTSLETSFLYIRKRLAVKLARPQLTAINFKSIRHWGGTTIAENTNGNVLIVKQLLRHKCIESSMKYIHAKKFEPKEYEETTATTIEEIRNLGKGGWTKYDEITFNQVQVHFYRRPKRFTDKPKNLYGNSENIKRYSYKPNLVETSPDNTPSFSSLVVFSVCLFLHISLEASFS